VAEWGPSPSSSFPTAALGHGELRLASRSWVRRGAWPCSPTSLPLSEQPARVGEEALPPASARGPPPHPSRAGLGGRRSEPDAEPPPSRRERTGQGPERVLGAGRGTLVKGGREVERGPPRDGPGRSPRQARDLGASGGTARAPGQGRRGAGPGPRRLGKAAVVGRPARGRRAEGRADGPAGRTHHELDGLVLNHRIGLHGGPASLSPRSSERPGRRRRRRRRQRRRSHPLSLPARPGRRQLRLPQLSRRGAAQDYCSQRPPRPRGVVGAAGHPGPRSRRPAAGFRAARSAARSVRNRRSGAPRAR
jgi:hypothetical protein